MEEELTSLGLLPEGEFARNWPDFNDDWGLAFPNSLIDWPDCETGLVGWSGMGVRNTENDTISDLSRYSRIGHHQAAC